MNLKTSSSREIDSSLNNFIQKESEILHHIIEHLAEIDRRKAYLEFGFPSLFEYLTRGKKYSAASAQRRIDAARLAKEVPAVIEKIKEGSINLHQLSEVQRADREFKKQN